MRLVMKTAYWCLALVLLNPVQTYAASLAQVAKLTPSDVDEADQFGISVAVSGNTAISGAAGKRSAYLFDVTSGFPPAKLTPSDGDEIGGFGFSVGLSNTTAIIGAWADENRGSAYLFDVSSRSQSHKLVPNDGALGDLFGWSVSVSGNTAIVGSPLNNSKGSVYLFDNSTGSQISKLTAKDGAQYDHFGWSLGVSGNTAIVGAYSDDDKGLESGSAYLFDIPSRSQIAKLTANDGAEEDGFGVSVAISGNIAIVGAPGDDDNDRNSGSAYLFDIPTRTQIAKLTPTDGATYNRFGNSVAISGNLAIVAAYQDDDHGAESGSMYLFDIPSGVQLAKFAPSDGAEGDTFGNSVGISGSSAVVGAYQDGDNGPDSGSVYIVRVVPEPNALLLGALSAGGLVRRRRRLI